MIRQILEAIDEVELRPTAQLAKVKPLTHGDVKGYFESIGWVDGDAWEDGEGHPGDGWFPPSKQYEFIGTSYAVPEELWDEDEEKWLAVRDDPSVPVARVLNALDLGDVHEIPATLEAIKKAVAELEGEG